MAGQENLTDLTHTSGGQGKGRAARITRYFVAAAHRVRFGDAQTPDGGSLSYQSPRLHSWGVEEWEGNVLTDYGRPATRRRDPEPVVFATWIKAA